MNWKTSFRLCTIAALCFLSSCKKEKIFPLDLVSLEANSENLLLSPDQVAVNAQILATFTTAIDPLSVDTTTVRLTREYDHSTVPLVLIVFGEVLSIKPAANFLPGATYTVVITSGVRSKNGDPVESVTATFKTAGQFVPEGEVAYWSFEDTEADIVGPYDPTTANVTGIIHASSKNDSSGMAAVFNGTTSVIQILNGISLLKPEFTISLWMYIDSDGHTDSGGNQKGNFVFGIGNVHGLQLEVHPHYEWIRFSQGMLLKDKTKTTSDFVFSADGATKDNIQSNPNPVIAGGIDNATLTNQNFGAAGLTARLDKTWAHIVFTTGDSSRVRKLFINGEKMYEQDLKLLASTSVNANLRPLATVTSMAFVPDLPPTYDDKLVFGFWQNKEATYGGETGVYSNINANHFKGMLDDVRIFKRMLTETEVAMIYEGEKP